MKKKYFLFLASLLFFCILLSAQEEQKMKVWSPAFGYGEEIPVKYSCDGANISIPIYFALLPEESRSLVLIMDDPDAPGGDFVHWILYNIPADRKFLPEDMTPLQIKKEDIREGLSNFGKIGYGGPCPPSGTHRYYIRLYALDIPSDFEPGLSRDDLLKRIKGHVLAEAKWMGLYSR